MFRKQTRMPHGVRDNRSAVAKSDSATLTELEIMSYAVVTQSGATKTITVPAAAAVYKGCRLIIANISTNADNKITVAAGFNGGGTSYDYLTLPAYAAVEIFCDGTNWYAIGSVDPAAS